MRTTPSENREEFAGLLNNIDKTSQDPNISADGPGNSNPYRQRFLFLIPILLLSLITNIITISIIAANPEPYRTHSKYADLHLTHTEPYVLLTDYSSPNTTLADTLWHSINIDSGVVALPDSFATSHNLRTAQRFPWDTSKGIYILHGFHNLHCLKIIYISLFEFREGQTQTRTWHHIAHCLDALRRQIICDADDTPRATERRVEVVSGVGQNRVCRNWGELENWAKAHTSCYRRPEKPEDETGLKRFMHCPEGSGYVVDEGYVPEEEILVGLPEESIATGLAGEV
ncbi:hypothetical protein DTO013E5_7647 [Penicillium roqueforti]|uniref:Uncharacterized protein n=1 Tax=Penicillium roqueforti (strain FM164) TaxID=1365484 RepID=W6QMA7_PENRF|nr:uncharacterized protein LCP9604111_9689 [Penicillium roqueforti]CDM37565.1 Protein of unknown function DUF3328 [Penicillium roqueforti FM164]KAF9237687.1 hypothetical protein LCP9604111_9689 [Penicillium roqueforti]KAI2695964.1 hypothetical protein CBS147372_8841 [Penicillium roqueforti]KAI2696432.1 hypothetical protein CBS147332_8999 [Penicillium roqueforti]KAI2743208.1 hypothetical protein DTO012A1_3122 [Penicillium roqueforti]